MGEGWKKWLGGKINLRNDVLNEVTFISLCKLILFFIGNFSLFYTFCHCIDILDQPIWIMVRVFANGLGDLGSIPGWVIPKKKKKKEEKKKKKRGYLMLPCLTLSIIRHVKGKWSNPGKGVAPSLTPQYSNHWKGSLWVALDYSLLTYLLSINILINFIHDKLTPL